MHALTLAAIAICTALVLVLPPRGPAWSQQAGIAGTDAARAVHADAYSKPAAHLRSAERERFAQGEKLFRQRWVVAPSAFGRWGRGPLSNGEACTDCHAGNGRGRPPLDAGEPLRSGLVRLGLGPVHASGPHPRYGNQLQFQGILGTVPGEGEAYVDWIDSRSTLSDGTVVALRRPRVRFASLTLGDIGADTHTSLRVAPPLIGLGLLAAVPLAALEEIEEQQRAQRISGRLHRLRAGAGRFGFKAAQADLRGQIATALHADLGVTSSIYPAQDCMPAQEACNAVPGPDAPEISDEELALLEEYLTGLSPPEGRDTGHPAVQRGARLFAHIECAACHRPALPLDGHRAALAYSDLLLHDLGEDLADGLPEGAAGPQEWRTAPLWGLGLSGDVNGHAFLLHDGRARSIEEAILWHGGEAQRAREAYRALPRAAREDLDAFLRSL
jgi:CxxC motif-containing protein (DUF1111 family)